MWIERARITNYKSFLNSGDISFTTGVNVIVGANDVGKSALLEAIGLRFQAVPHRSMATAPFRSSPVDGASRVTLHTRHSGDELRALLAPHAAVSFRATPSALKDGGRALLDSMLSDGVTIISNWTNGGYSGPVRILGDEELPDQTGWLTLANTRCPTNFACEAGTHSSSQGGVYVADALLGTIQSRIYSFRAERLNVGSAAVGANGGALTPDASNLAIMLNDLLSTNPPAAGRYRGLVSRVFPHICMITSGVSQQGMATLNVWTDPGTTSRPDLAIPLQNSGTGIGQVLAMLYVVLTAQEPQTILIDEPQSFLHPGAVRTLFEILREFPQHQYIVTTHAPATVAATEVVTLHHVRRKGTESIVEPISATKQVDVQSFLADVGANLSDVFGADRVLWVEGKTEEFCFPLIARAHSIPLRGTKIVAVRSTERHQRQDAATVFDVYEQLLGAPSLLPPRFAFLFDTEGLPEAKRDALTKRSKGVLRWLPRRMFENYLLNTDAIASALASDDSPEGRPSSALAPVIEEWINNHGNDSAYWPNADREPAPPPIRSKEWFERVHGANLLGGLFSEVTNSRVDYNKVRHGPKLTEALLAKNDPSLAEVSELLRTLLT
jgi:AAA domain, putative AbiEii toxin, Type IV TA system/AAA domain